MPQPLSHACSQGVCTGWMQRCAPTGKICVGSTPQVTDKQHSDGSSLSSGMFCCPLRVDSGLKLWDLSCTHPSCEDRAVSCTDVILDYLHCINGSELVLPQQFPELLLCGVFSVPACLAVKLSFLGQKLSIFLELTPPSGLLPGLQSFASHLDNFQKEKAPSQHICGLETRGRHG